MSCLFRKDINLGAAIEALQAKNLLQMLAEPNVMATSGQPASFIDGGKIPVPVLESSLTPGAVTIQYYPYGIQLRFSPGSYAARNHSPQGHSGSERSRLLERRERGRHHGSGLHLAEGRYRGRTRGRARASSSLVCWITRPRRR